MSSSAIKKPKVVIRLSHMGDVALTTGVLAHWNETHCDHFIYITRAGHTPLLDNHPAISKVIALDDSDLKTGAWIRKSMALAKEFADHTLVDLHGTLRSRILSFFWKGPIQRYPKFGLERRLFDRTKAAKYKKILEATNVPQRYAMAYGEKPAQPADLVPRIFLSDKERVNAAEKLNFLPQSQPRIALHPYATHPSKEWPRKNWLSLIQLLNDAHLSWFIVGRDSEPLYTGHERDLTNDTNLRETFALLDQADLLVTGDSGPMHLASGVGTPVAALFGPTVKAWGFFPAGPKDRVIEHDLPCRPCSLHGGKVCDKNVECLGGITPEEVFRNVLAMIP